MVALAFDLGGAMDVASAVATRLGGGAHRCLGSAGAGGIAAGREALAVRRLEAD